MWVRMTKMRENGVAIDKRLLNDRSSVKRVGELTVLDTTDQGLRRQVKVARLIQQSHHTSVAELIDPHVLWMSGERFVLSGFERRRNAAGQDVDYAQSWLCTLEKQPEQSTQIRAADYHQ